MTAGNKNRDLERRIFDIRDEEKFHSLALKVFSYQSEHNPVYKKYLDYLGIKPGSVKSIEEIPFMPISFFKQYKVMAGGLEAEAEFHSSGTTGMDTSKHFIADTAVYKKSLLEGFRYFYGDPEQYHIIALLPSYMENPNSSLIYMIRELISASRSRHSGFMLRDMEKLPGTIEQAKRDPSKKLMIWGVSYALLDLAEGPAPDLSGSLVFETGGMKGRRKEMLKEELHAILKDKLKLNTVHSEYGMTELLSQAYSKGGGIFQAPPWMKIMIRDIYDPFSYVQENSTGGINIIDLANLYSCSFIAADDLGSLQTDDGFRVLGRFDSSEIRGCNLLVN